MRSQSKLQHHTKKYWYFAEVEQCEMCGYEDVTKKRMYTKKPKDKRKRFEIYPCYWCKCHFPG